MTDTKSLPSDTDRTTSIKIKKITAKLKILCAVLKQHLFSHEVAGGMGTPVFN